MTSRGKQNIVPATMSQTEIDAMLAKMAALQNQLDEITMSPAERRERALKAWQTDTKGYVSHLSDRLPRFIGDNLIKAASSKAGGVIYKEVDDAQAYNSAIANIRPGVILVVKVNYSEDRVRYNHKVTKASNVELLTGAGVDTYKSEGKSGYNYSYTLRHRVAGALNMITDCGMVVIFKDVRK